MLYETLPLTFKTLEVLAPTILFLEILVEAVATFIQSS